jgi:hypothetical protein
MISLDVGRRISPLCMLLFQTDEFDSITMSKIRRLQHEHLNDADTAVVMDETFEARKKWILMKSPPIKTVLANFPPLKEVLSSHVSASVLFLYLSVE